jgi:titin
MHARRFAFAVTAALTMCLPLTAAAARGATVTVTGTADNVTLDGAVTLREAIGAINAQADSGDVVASGDPYGTNDTIAFAIGGGGPQTIGVGMLPLPTITKPVLVDGYTQPGSSANTLALGNDAVLNVVLQGTSGSGAHGLEVGTGGNGTIIRGLVLQRHFFAVQINASNVTVAGNFIGTDRTATAGDANTSNSRGVNVNIGNIGNNTIGGSTPADRNVISRNGFAIVLSSQLPNTIQGNYIGTNGAGTAALGNVGNGVNLGSVGVPGGGGATIGGVTATPGQGAGNVIAGNGSHGIQAQTNGGTTSIGAVTIEGNILGLDANGNDPLPNTGANVYLRDQELPSDGIPRLGPVTIGGSVAGAGNVISAAGIGIFNLADGTVIRANRIGTDVTGTLARPNTFAIEVTGTGAFVGSATIGGSGAGEGNVIASSSSDAIRVFLSSATIQGNLIGVGATGGALGNGGYGIFVDSGETTIGGTGAGAGNTIANSGNYGVLVRVGFPAVRNASNAAILGNSITGNALLGINNSAPDVVTPNDPGDADSGPNDLQNFPVVTGAALGAGTVTVSGTLDSTASTTFRVELFSNVACGSFGHGQGLTYLGFVNVTTDGAGNASFGPAVFAAPGGQAVITATATNPSNRTSEFSACVTATGPPAAPTSLAATSMQNQVAVGWVDNAGDETSYRVGRALALPGPRLGGLGSTAANVVTFDDVTAACNTAYLYRVRAHRAGDNAYSAYSNVASVTHLCPDLTVTKNASASAVTTGQTWTWTLAVDNGGSGPATLAGGQTLLADALPAASYSNLVVTPGPGVTGTLGCGIAAGTLTCSASTTVVIPAGDLVTIAVDAVSSTPAVLTNGGGGCEADPAGALVETIEANNQCNTSTVDVQGSGIFADGFEDGVLPGPWTGGVTP